MLGLCFQEAALSASVGQAWPFAGCQNVLLAYVGYVQRFWVNLSSLTWPTSMLTVNGGYVRGHLPPLLLSGYGHRRSGLGTTPGQNVRLLFDLWWFPLGGRLGCHLVGFKCTCGTPRCHVSFPFGQYPPVVVYHYCWRHLSPICGVSSPPYPPGVQRKAASMTGACPAPSGVSLVSVFWLCFLVLLLRGRTPHPGKG